MVSWKVLATALLVPFVLAACGPDGPEVAMGGTGEPDATAVPPDGAEDGDGDTDGEPTTDGDLVLRVDQGVGAFTLAQLSFAQLPTFLVTADGTLIGPGAQLAIYPGPLLPALQARQLTDDEVAEALDLAEQHGLFEDFEDRSLATAIADVGSTVVRLRRDGVTSTSDVYALGMGGLPLAPEVEAKHRELVAFIDELRERFDGPGGAPAEVFEPDRYVIGVMPVDLAHYATSDVAPTVRPWPAALGDETATCRELAGPAVRDALGSASQLTFYQWADGSTVELLVRPLLPGSAGCGG
jgi:hypothetical protein